ncbi:hypothetical protein CBL_10393 [Carabus blaptoides fortunei]
MEEENNDFRGVLLLTGTGQNRSSNWLNVIPEHVPTTTRSVRLFLQSTGSIFRTEKLRKHCKTASTEDSASRSESALVDVNFYSNKVNTTMQCRVEWSVVTHKAFVLEMSQNNNQPLYSTLFLPSNVIGIQDDYCGKDN